jgi:hypothetical protein
MNDQVAKQIIDKIVGQVFGYQNPLSTEQVIQKFAFDVRLPQQVYDSLTGKPTWASSTNPAKFVSHEAQMTLPEGRAERPKRPVTSIQDILAYWQETNYMASERYNDCINVAESDNIRKSENVYRSQDVGDSKNIIFSDGIYEGCESLLASQRSSASTYGIRVEESSLVSNSFSVNWSAKIVNSFFIQDCYDMQDCMFCSHLTGKQYWIANMPFEQEEYMRIKDMVVRWILTS